jgi:hypothetical protein
LGNLGGKSPHFTGALPLGYDGDMDAFKLLATPYLGPTDAEILSALPSCGIAAALVWFLIMLMFRQWRFSIQQISLFVAYLGALSTLAVANLRRPPDDWNYRPSIMEIAGQALVFLIMISIAARIVIVFRSGLKRNRQGESRESSNSD